MCRGFDHRVTGGAIDDHEHARRGGRGSAGQRVRDGAVEQGVRTGHAGEGDELLLERGLLEEIARVRPIGHGWDVWRAGAEHRDQQERSHGESLLYGGGVNAVERFAANLAPESLRRVAALEVRRFEPWFSSLPLGGEAPASYNLDLEAAHERVVERWRDDLCGLLNALVRDELGDVARREGVQRQMIDDASVPQLRVVLWERGASLERGGARDVSALQPRPVILGGHLVIQAPPRGMYPGSAMWPRPLPLEMPAQPPEAEPDSIDELLAAADRLIGVRLGTRGADKGAWGTRAAGLVGVIERGGDEPDWRGDVEIKTVPVGVDASGLWRVVEDPAIAMVDLSPAGGRTQAIAKLQRTLWLARADLDGGDATIVSWYLLEWDARLAQLARRYLHDRPKGPAGTDQRGVYLHKRFFADAGMLATLNGPS